MYRSKLKEHVVVVVFSLIKVPSDWVSTAAEQDSVGASGLFQPSAVSWA